LLARGQPQARPWNTSRSRFITPMSSAMALRSLSPVAAATVVSRATSAISLRTRSFDSRSSPMTCRRLATGWFRSSGLIF